MGIDRWHGDRVEHVLRNWPLFRGEKLVDVLWPYDGPADWPYDDPRDSQLTVSASQALAQLVGFLGNKTRDPGSFGSAEEAARVLANIHKAVTGLKLVLAQASMHYSGEVAADQDIKATGRGWFVPQTVAEVVGHLDRARVRLGPPATSLRLAREASSHLTTDPT